MMKIFLLIDDTSYIVIIFIIFIYHVFVFVKYYSYIKLHLLFQGERERYAFHKLCDHSHNYLR